jgi:hypothetical protein
VTEHTLFKGIPETPGFPLLLTADVESGARSLNPYQGCPSFSNNAVEASEKVRLLKSLIAVEERLPSEYQEDSPQLIAHFSGSTNSSEDTVLQTKICTFFTSCAPTRMRSRVAIVHCNLPFVFLNVAADYSPQKSFLHSSISTIFGSSNSTDRQTDSLPL